MATQAEARSLSEIEREAEHTRADLIHTVDELHNRVSPQAIKEEVKAYVRETKQDFIRNLERRARENPFPTIAVAAGLAYPVWRLLMNIPVPVLLVGAGLALTRGGGTPWTGAHSTGGFGEAVGDTMKRTVQDASSTMSDTLAGMKDTLASAKDTLASAKEKTAGMAGDAKAAMTARMNEAADRMNDAADRAASAMGDAVSSARTVASDTVSAAQQTLSGAYQSGVDALQSGADAMVRTRDQLTDTLRQSSGTLVETIESYPFVWGAVGLVVGAAIASALPVTQAENRLFGDASDQLKNRAGDLANRGMQVATEATQDVYQDAVSRAKEQGVGPEVVRETIKDAADKVRSAVAQASDALEKEQAASTPPLTTHINPRMGD
jgi:hypothetical protein